MKNIFKILLIISVLLSTGWVFGQSKEVDYALASETITASGLEVSTISTINKIGNTLEWKQEARGNASSTIFEINDTSGNWNKNKSKGSLAYTISFEAYAGLFTLEETSSGLVATLSLKQGEIDEQFIFQINTITYL